MYNKISVKLSNSNNEATYGPMPSADYADKILLCSITAAATQWPTVLYYANRFTRG